MAESGEGTPKPTKPDRIITSNGSKAEIYNFQKIVEGTPQSPEVIIVYDRADFNTPIERAQIVAERVARSNGERGIAYTGYILIDRSRVDTSKLFSSIIDQHAEIANNYHEGKDGDDTVTKTHFKNVFNISHKNGTKAVCWIDEKNWRIEFSNYEVLTGGPNKEYEVLLEPPAEHTVDQLDTFSDFLYGFMRTADIVAASTSQYPSSIIRNILKKTYVVGKEIPRASREQQQQEQKPNHTPLSDSSSKETSDLDLGLVESQITLDDVIVADRVKQQMRDIAISFKHPEIMSKWSAERPQGVILYGEPGTGKTMLTQALAHEIGAQLFEIKSTDIYGKWLGESQKRMQEIFAKIKQADKPLVVLFDEIDAIIGISEDPRPGGADNERNAVAGIFKQELNTISKKNPNVLFVATTNNLDRIDDALIRSGRFDHKIYVPMPDAAARNQIIASIVAKAMMTSETEGFKIFGEDLNTQALSEATDGMSGADLTEVFRRLRFEKAMEEARGKNVEPINQQDMLTAVHDFRANG